MVLWSICFDVPHRLHGSLEIPDSRDDLREEALQGGLVVVDARIGGVDFAGKLGTASQRRPP